MNLDSIETKVGKYIRQFILDATPAQIVELLDGGDVDIASTRKPILIGSGGRILGATDDFKEEEHPRGQPKNAGQFAKKGSTSGKGWGNLPDEEEKPVVHRKGDEGQEQRKREQKKKDYLITQLERSLSPEPPPRKNEPLNPVEKKLRNSLQEAGIVSKEGGKVAFSHFESDDHKAQAVATVIDRHKYIMDNFPKIKELVEKHGGLGRLHLVGGPNIEDTPEGDAMGNVENTGGAFYELNNGMILSAGKSESNLGLSIGASNVAYDRPSMYAHEFGHYIWNVLKQKYDPIAEAFKDTTKVMVIHFNNMYEPEKVAQEVAKGLSWYGLSKGEEMWAETFCAWTHPDYGKGKERLLPELEAFMKAFFPKADITKPKSNIASLPKRSSFRSYDEFEYYLAIYYGLEAWKKRAREKENV